MVIGLRIFRYAGFLILLLSFSACEVVRVPDERKDWHFDLPSFSHRQTEFTDEEIYAAAYSDYQYPEQFYTEDLGGAHHYYIFTDSISLSGAFERYELCTNDYHQAKEWLELATAHISYNYIGDRETPKYFEFRRQKEDNPSVETLFRIHKCAYLDRSMYNRFDGFAPGIVLGVFHFRPFTTDRVTELIEYLWFRENYVYANRKVLSSFTDKTFISFIHTLYEVSLVHGDWDMYDSISLYKTTFMVDKSSGEITRESELVKHLRGIYNSYEGIIPSVISYEGKPPILTEWFTPSRHVSLISRILLRYLMAELIVV